MGVGEGGGCRGPLPGMGKRDELLQVAGAAAAASPGGTWVRDAAAREAPGEAPAMDAALGRCCPGIAASAR